MPSDTHEAMRNPKDNHGSGNNAAGNINRAHTTSPVTANDLRTRVGEAPREIHRSEAHPPVSDAAAIPQNGNDP